MLTNCEVEMPVNQSSLKTAVVMVTIGPDSWTRRFSVPRARKYAEKHGYDFVQIKESAITGGVRTPHWEKTLVPKVQPGYDRYLIIDDDILINDRLAPVLPDIASSKIGLVREPLPDAADCPVPWVANSGVMLLHRASADILADAYAMGEITDIVPGYGEQPAINKVAWREDRVSQLDWKWNYIVMADWLITAHKQKYPWTAHVLLARIAKLTLSARLGLEAVFLKLRLNTSGSVVSRLRESYFVHLIAYRMGAKLVDTVLG